MEEKIINITIKQLQQALKKQLWGRMEALGNNNNN